MSRYIKKFDPFLLKGMRYSMHRIIKAINEREKIVIYGYHDVNGIVSVSLLLLALRYLNADVEYFIPNDVNCSRDLSSEDIENHIESLGTDLIITVGCGIKSHYEVELCTRLDIDIIVVDNKSLIEELSNITLINPKQHECNYPFKELSGCGVVYKLVQALSRYYKITAFNKYIDLVMFGIISSKEPLINENRVFVEAGIEQLHHTNNYGIRALLKIHEISKINLMNISRLIYTLIPTINAVGSMDNAKIVVELFTTTDNLRAEQIGKYLAKEAKNCCFT